MTWTRRAAGLFAAALLALGCGAHRGGKLSPRRPADRSASPLTFLFFHMGQADAMLVVYRGRTLLMDAGESRHEPDRTRFHQIAQRLEELTGRRYVDVFVLSHYHQDHVGASAPTPTGLFGMLDEDGVRVGLLVDRGEKTFSAKGPPQVDYEAAVPRWLKERKVERHLVVEAGDALSLGDGLSVEVIAANGNGVLADVATRHPDTTAAYPISENDYSVALKFTYGDFELYAGGDLSGKDMLRDYKGNRDGMHDIESVIARKVGDVEIYRVNHHGSLHSSNPCFLKVLHPEVSVISSGVNSYGHPAPPVVRALRASGAVFITGGADEKVLKDVAAEVVGDDVVVDVAEGGKRFWVNQRLFRALGEGEERSRPGFQEGCEEATAGALP